MAQERATIVAHALDGARIDLTPIRDRRPPVEATERAKDASSENILGGFASLRPVGKRERMVPYPIRLPTAQIAELEQLREERGIIPAEFIRDAVASCLALLRRS